MPAETLTLPARHRVGVDHDQCSSPALPHPGQRNSEPAVLPDQPWMSPLAFVNSQLLAEREILQDDRFLATPEQPDQSKETE